MQPKLHHPKKTNTSRFSPVGQSLHFLSNTFPDPPRRNRGVVRNAPSRTFPSTRVHRRGTSNVCDDGANPYGPASRTSNNLDPYIYASRARSRHDRRSLRNTFNRQCIRPQCRIFSKRSFVEFEHVEKLVGLPTDSLQGRLYLNL